MSDTTAWDGTMVELAVTFRVPYMVVAGHYGDVKSLEEAMQFDVDNALERPLEAVLLGDDAETVSVSWRKI